MSGAQIARCSCCSVAQFLTPTVADTAGSVTSNQIATNTPLSTLRPRSATTSLGSGSTDAATRCPSAPIPVTTCPTRTRLTASVCASTRRTVSPTVTQAPPRVYATLPASFASGILATGSPLSATFHSPLSFAAHAYPPPTVRQQIQGPILVVVAIVFVRGSILVSRPRSLLATQTASSPYATTLAFGIEKARSIRPVT